MTWTYNGDPSENSIATVHFLIGDTDIANQVASDEECQWALTLESDYWLAAANIMEAKARMFARQATMIKTLDTTFDYGERSREYKDQALQLRIQSGIRTVMPYAGGLSVGDKNLEINDTDRVQPAATRVRHDFKGNRTSDDPTAL